MCIKKRKHEAFHTHTPYIKEFYNTISNLPFIMVGLARLYDGSCGDLVIPYILMVMAGLCSGVHHAMLFKWSIIVDWVPIMTSIAFIIYHGYYMLFNLSIVVELGIAISFLIADHQWTVIPVPFGHVLWHVVAAFAVDTMYQGIQ